MVLEDVERDRVMYIDTLTLALGLLSGPSASNRGKLPKCQEKQKGCVLQTPSLFRLSPILGTIAHDKCGSVERILHAAHHGPQGAAGVLRVWGPLHFRRGLRGQ